MLGGLEGSQARRMMRDDLSDDGRTPAPLAGAAHGLTHDTPSALILTGSNGPAMPADARQVAGNRRSLAAGGEGRLQCPMDLLDETLAHIAAELTIALIRLPDLSSRLREHARQVRIRLIMCSKRQITTFIKKNCA